jgi:TonB-linked SusC/RagA family outer membrane protein
MNHKLSHIFIFLLLCFNLPAQQQQQDKPIVVEGTVYDEAGDPFEGVTIYVKDKATMGATTDANGKFSFKVLRGNTLVFSFVGYGKVEYLVIEEKKDVEIRLKEDSQLDEVVVVGLGTQRKISSVAAVSTIDTKELQVPAPSIANMLGGRMAGIITMQSSGEPGKNLAEFWVRGIGTFGANSSALVLIDGLEGDLNSIDPADVENFSVLKDASATAVYGVRGANGVVLVTTKRGVEGKLQITVRSNFSISQVKRLPKYLRAYDYAKLVNEAYEARNENPRYSDIELSVIKDGLDPDLYPDVSWQDEILNNVSFKHTQFASARGGGAIARYYVSMGLSNESAAYKVEDSPYASNAGYNTYSFRSNLDMNLTKSTVLYFGSDVFISVNNLPGQVNTDYIWEAQSQLTPLLFPKIYSNGQLPSYGTNALMSPYTLINRTGKSSTVANSSLLTLALSQDLSMITEGLKLRIQGAYNRNGSVTQRRYAQPALYLAEGRNSRGDLVTRLRVAEQGVRYAKEDQIAYRKYHLEGVLNYDRVFGTKHRAGGLIYYYMSDELNTKDMTSSLNAIPKRYQGISSRLTYGFMDTYMIDVNFGYTGSENFMRGQQFGFFPSVALGWVPTSYKWVKDHLEWVDFFKIRGSYGTVGNDRLAGDRRFPYITRINRGTGSPWGSYGVETVNVSVVGADNLMWERAIKSDIGIDARFLERISLTVDIFNDQRNGIFQPRIQIPDFAGLVSDPYGNVGKMRSWGSDGNISFTQNISKDMSFTIRANYTYSQNLVQNWEKLNEVYPYKETSGLPNGAVRGYQSLGLYKDENDVKYSPKLVGLTVMPGDIKYKDINGDGKIDVDDQVPLSFSSMYPLVMYGIGGEFRYKNLSAGILFKGTGKVDYYRNGMGYIPFHGEETGNVLVQFNNPANRWIPAEYAAAHGIDPALAENPNAMLPRLQYGPNTNNSQISDFWKGDARYLRLQEVTINYSIRSSFLKRIGVTSVDLQLVGNNLYVWDKVKIFDPEQADKRGQVYPIPAVYSLQLYINL